MRKWLFLIVLAVFLIILAINIPTDTANLRVLSVYDDRLTFFEKLLPKIRKDINENKFEEVVSRLKDRDGDYGIYIKDLDNGRVYKFNEDELFYGASLFKTPIAVAVLKEIQLGNIDMEDQLEFQSRDASDGTGTINSLGIGTRLSFDYVLDRLLKDSDNTAQNMLLRHIAPYQVRNAFEIIPVKNYFLDSNNVTPYQIAALFEELLAGNYLTSSYKEILLNKMSETSFDDRISSGLKEDLEFAHKIGNWGDTGSWHDCGVVYDQHKKVVVCLMSRNTTFEDFILVSVDLAEFVNILF